MNDLGLSFADFQDAADLISQIAVYPDEVEATLPPNLGGTGIYHSGHSALVAWVGALRDDPDVAKKYFFHFLLKWQRIIPEVTVQA